MELVCDNGSGFHLDSDDTCVDTDHDDMENDDDIDHQLRAGLSMMIEMFPTSRKQRDDTTDNEDDDTDKDVTDEQLPDSESESITLDHSLTYHHKRPLETIA